MKKIVITLLFFSACGTTEVVDNTEEILTESLVTTSIPETTTTSVPETTTTSVPETTTTVKTIIDPMVTIMNCSDTNISNDSYELQFQINSGSGDIVNLGIFEQKNGESYKNVFFDIEYNTDIFTFPLADTVNEYSYIIDNAGNNDSSTHLIEISVISEDGSGVASCEIVYTPNQNNSSTTTTTSSSTTTTTTTVISVDYPQLTISEISSSIPEYDRDDWNHWIDENGDCQNTRHEVLIEESFETVTYTNDTFCSVGTGKWYGNYTGQYYYNASELDIDHFIPLKNAHQSGGYNWSSAKKEEFANYRLDPDNLIAVNLSANRSKGAKGPDEWKPSNTEYWCEYAYDWIRIKDYWNLTATQAEWDALVSMIETCPAGFAYADAEEEPVVELPTPTTTTSSTTTTSTSTTTTVASSQPDNPGDTKNCGDFSNYSEAKAWFDTYYEYYGDVANLDGDNDGEPCESLPGGP